MLGAAWTGTALILILGPAGGRSVALGVFLLMMAANMIALAAGAAKSKPAFGALLLIGASRFVLTGVFQAIPSTAKVVEQISGWIGIPLAAFTLYGGVALLLEDAAQRTLLPIGRRAGPGLRSRVTSPIRSSKPNVRLGSGGNSENRWRLSRSGQRDHSRSPGATRRCDHLL